MAFNVQQAFELIRTNEELANQVSKRNPKIEADIVSARLNPNCSCKGRIIKHLEETTSEHQPILDWIEKNPEIAQKALETIKISPIAPVHPMIQSRIDNARLVLKNTLPHTEWPKYKDVIGEIVEIEPDPDKYKKLMTIAREQWSYNGLSILETAKTDPTTNESKIVWLVFFY